MEEPGSAYIKGDIKILERITHALEACLSLSLSEAWFVPFSMNVNRGYKKRLQNLLRLLDLTRKRGVIVVERDHKEEVIRSKETK
jgi:hypothetical protein